MLRSHHLYCMAIHIEKTCEVNSFGDPGKCVPGVCLRCKLLYGVIVLDSDALQCLTLVDRRYHYNICGCLVSYSTDY